jgi:hypothetical protein
MNMARVCCCEPAMSSCCDFWACSGNTTPKTNITISFTFTNTRYYDTGESIVLSEGTWTVQSVGVSTRQGTNCTSGLWDGFAVALVTWDYKVRTPAFLHTGTGSTIDGTTETANPAACAGCLYPGPSCKYDGALCTDVYVRDYGSQTITGSPNALRYECHTGCFGCVRPMVSYTPPSITLTGLQTTQYLCECRLDPDVGPDSSIILFNGFSVAGACGCPTVDTWVDPISITTNPTGQCGPQNIPYNACILACNCEFIDAAEFTTGKGSITLTWQCQDFYPDPTEPVTIECSRTITYYDRCVQNITVSVS